MLSQSPIQGYLETDYCFRDIILTINKVSVDAATLLKPFAPKGGIFITAWNFLGKSIWI